MSNTISFYDYDDEATNDPSLEKSAQEIARENHNGICNIAGGVSASFLFVSTVSLICDYLEQIKPLSDTAVISAACMAGLSTIGLACSIVKYDRSNSKSDTGPVLGQ